MAVSDLRDRIVRDYAVFSRSFMRIKAPNIRAPIDERSAGHQELTRSEVQYLLEPQDARGTDCTVNSIDALHQAEEREFGEYGPCRLVLEAWDRTTSARGPGQRERSRRVYSDAVNGAAELPVLVAPGASSN